MRLTTRVLALFLSVAMALSMTGCTGNVDWAAEKGGKQMKAGVFLYYLLEAYMTIDGRVKEMESAEGYEGDTELDFLRKELDGMSVSDTIIQQGWEGVDRHYAVWDMVERYGVPLGDDFEDEVDDYVNDRWPNYEQMMLKNGISEPSFYEIARTIVATNHLFEYYYSENGPEPTTASDLADVFTDAYARMLTIEIPYAYDTNNYYDVDAINALEAKANEMVARLNAGENFAEVQDGYNAWKMDFDVNYLLSHPDISQEEAAAEDAYVPPMQYDAPYDLPDAVSEAERKKAFESHGVDEQVHMIASSSSYADLVDQFFEMDYYTAELLTSDYAAGYFVSVRLDMLASEEKMEENYAGALAYAKAEAFNLILTEHGKSVGYTRNEAAYTTYTPNKLTPVA